MTKSYFGSLLGAASTIALALAGTAYAQESEEVVVTGTRLQSGFTAPTPLATVSAENIDNKAPAAIIEVLYDNPAFKQNSGVNQTTRNFNVNATVDLRGLGNIRTLTLVNGLRQVGTNLQVFDTNRIPSNLVDRVEIVTGGASAAYGSDAVGGVVNFILNDRLEGIRTNAQYSFNEIGDNAGATLSFAAGRGFANDRGHVIFGTEYAQADGTGNIYSRGYSAGEPGLISPNAAQRAALGLPANVYTDGVEFLATGTPGGIITSGPLAGTAFAPDGTPYALQLGTQYGSPGAGLALTNLMVGSTANRGQTTIGTFSIAVPLKRAATMARATFDLTPNVTAFADYSYTYNYSESATGNQQVPNGILGTFTLQGDNYYLPAATRAAMTSAGVTNFRLGIVPVAAVGQGRGHTGYFSQTRTFTMQTNVGLRGKLGENWDWDAAWSHGWYHGLASFKNVLHNPNFAAATYVVADANGNPVCGPLASNPNLNATTRALVDPGCVPFNIFGQQASQAAVDYVSRATRPVVANKQDTFVFNVSGTPFELWAGPLSVAAGGEYRKDELEVRGDGLNPAALALGGTTPYAGERNVKEGYLEFGVPLLKDMPFIQALDFNTAVRRTDYELSGAVTTYKAGFTWDVNDAIRFRATQSRDIRAPNLTELFQLGAQGVNQGLRNPFNNQVGAIITRGGGNPALKPEVAQTFTYGVVLRPTWEWADRFTLTTDYYWIKLKGVIASVNAQDTMNRCFAGIQSYCDAITFDGTGTGGISEVSLRTYNLNQLRVRGVDIDAAYDAPIEAIGVPGKLRVHATGSYQPVLTTIDSANVIVNAAGAATGVPEWRWVANFDYSVGKFATQLQANYTNQILTNPTFIGPDDPSYESIKTTSPNTVNKNLFPGMVYWNMSAQYELDDNFTLYGNVTNLMDKKPPQLAMIGFTGVGGQFNPYDTIGRAFRIGVRGKF